MAWRLAAAAALLVLVAMPAASAEVCTVQGPYGPVQYTCGTTAPKKVEPWWATGEAQAILAIVGLSASAAAGGYAFWRVRTRRQALTETMLALDRAYTETKGSPEAGILRLVALRQEVRDRHAKGKMDDGSFLELDKRATEHIVKLRFLELDRRFLGLPPALMAEVRRLVGDGHVSREDVDMVDRHAMAFRVPDARRAELVALVSSWCTDDGVPVQAAGVQPTHKLLVR